MSMKLSNAQTHAKWLIESLTTYAPAIADELLMLEAQRNELLEALKATQQALEDDCRDTERWFAVMSANVAAIAKVKGGAA